MKLSSKHLHSQTVRGGRFWVNKSFKKVLKKVLKNEFTQKSQILFKKVRHRSKKYKLLKIVQKKMGRSFTFKITIYPTSRERGGGVNIRTKKVAILNCGTSKKRQLHEDKTTITLGWWLVIMMFGCKQKCKINCFPAKRKVEGKTQYLFISCC